MNTEKRPGNPSLVSSDEDLKPFMALAEKVPNHYCVEDFFRSPQESAYTLSPDGNWLAFLSPVDSKRNIFVQRVGEENAHQITDYDKRDIFTYFWLNDVEIAFLVDNDGDEFFRLYRTDIHTREYVCLTPYEKTTMGIVDKLDDDPHHILVALNKVDERIFDLYRLHTGSGKLTLLEKNNAEEPVQSWLTDFDGNVRVRVSLRNGVDQVVQAKAVGVDNYHEVAVHHFEDSFTPLMIDDGDPDKLWVRSNVGRERAVATAISMTSGKEIGPVLFEHPTVDIGGVGISRARRRLVTITFEDEKPGIHFVDDYSAQLDKQIRSGLAELNTQHDDDIYYRIAHHDKAEQRFIIHQSSDTNIGDYYLFDSAGNSLTHLATVCPWLRREHMAKMCPIRYNSRDNLTIFGYLSMPKDTDGPIPFIINPHGGPWSRNSWGFDPCAQLFTSLGFGVLQMNFRGSTGYGRSFWRKGFKQWGRAMQDDISDGVQWLIDKNLADKNRIAIFGASYGGYAALAGVTYTPKLYCCAVDFVGVSNLLTFLNTIPAYWQPLLDMMYEMVGDPQKDKKELEKYSPASNADKIIAPLLVVQGAQDPRVNIDESDQVVRNLRNRDIEVLYMVKYDEGHGFAGEENRIEFFKLMTGFLITHLHETKQ